MFANYGKRILSFLLALVMALSLLPSQAFATELDAHEGHDHSHEEVIETIEPETEAVEIETEPVEVVETEPQVTEPVVTEPVTTEPVATEPVATEPAVKDAPLTEKNFRIPAGVDYPGWTDDMLYVQGMIDYYVDYYLTQNGFAMPEDIPQEEMTEEDWEAVYAQIEDIVLNTMDANERENAYAAIVEVEYEIADRELEDEQILLILEANLVFYDFSLLVEENTKHTNELALFTKEPQLDENYSVDIGLASDKHTYANGAVEISYNGSSGTKTDETSGFYKASGSLLGGSTNTITVKNLLEEKAVISFSYSLKNNNGTCSLGTNGQYSKTFEPGGTDSFTITGTGGFSAKTAELTLAGITCTAVSAKVAVTASWNSDIGTVTSSKDTLNNGTASNLEVGTVLTAAPLSGATFVGWVDSNTGAILTKEAAYTVSGAVSVKAAFASPNTPAWFSVGSLGTAKINTSLIDWSGTSCQTVDATNYMFEGLAAALTYAQANDQKGIVAVSDGTITGSHTIPAGYILLIPYNSSYLAPVDTPAYENRAVVDSNGKAIYPVAYRTVTLASGASLTVNGTLSVPAKIVSPTGSSRGGCSPADTYGYLKLAQGSAVTVNGKLSCYGYIGGSGEITVKSGANVYEAFQYEDYRGGDQTTQLVKGDQSSLGIFPMNSYYVMNILAPMTLESGATESCYACITAQKVAYGTNITFISNKDAMFNLESGSVTKEYDYARDRMVLTAKDEGDMKISNIRMSIATMSIDSVSYDLPINGSMTINIQSGSSITLNQDVVLLPGVELNVAARAECFLSSNATLFMFAKEDWSYNPSELGLNTSWNSFVAPQNQAMYPQFYVPDRQKTRTAADLTDVTIDIAGTINCYGRIYTTNGLAEITGKEGATVNMRLGDATAEHYQIIQHGTPSKSHFFKFTPAADPTRVSQFGSEGGNIYERVLLNARLKNSGGSYTKPDEEVNPDYGATYTYTNGTWVPRCNKNGTQSGCSYELPEGKFLCNAKRVCKYCGHEADPVDHTPDEENPATCTTAQVCTVCGDVLVAALGHNTTEVKTTSQVNPGCLSTGMSAYYQCPRCDCYFTDKALTTMIDNGSEEALEKWKAKLVEDGGGLIPASGHIGGETVELKDSTYVPATCTAGGQHYNVKYCTVCGQIAWKSDLIIDKALGHEGKEDITKEATCYEKGEKTITCGRKGCGYVGTEEIPMLDHTPDREAPTCEEPVKCTVDKCGAIITPALGHSTPEEVTEWVDLDKTVGELTYVAPTCTTDGHHYRVKYCEKCGTHIIASEKVTDKATDHNWGEVTYKWNDDNTCTATQKCNNAHCAASEKTRRQTVSGGTPVEDPATCQKPGSRVYTAVFNIEAFNTEASLAARTKTEVIEQKNHTIAQASNGQAAQCGKAGFKAYYQCSSCSQYFYANEQNALIGDEDALDTWKTEGTGLIPALEHSYTNYVYNEGSAKCGVDGTETAKCDNDCGTTDTRTKAGTALEHKYENYESDGNATCTTDGTETARCKNDCGTFDTRTEEGSATGHNWKALEPYDYQWVGTDKCTATLHCKNANCPLENKQMTVEAKIVIESKAPTCTDAGVTTYKAKFTAEGVYKDVVFADDLEKTENSVALGHDWNEPTYQWESDFSKCTASRTCKREGCAYPDNAQTETKTASAQTVNATCTAVGSKTYTVTFTNSAFKTDPKVVELSMNKHELKLAEAEVMATCKTDGHKAYYQCASCKQYFYAEEQSALIGDEAALDTWLATAGENGGKLTATDHAYGEPTYTWKQVDGNWVCTGTRTCGNDATHVDTKKVTATGAEETAAGCETKGKTKYTATFSAPFATQEKIKEDIPAKGHNLVKKDGQPADCENDGWKTYYQCDRDGCGKYFSDNTQNPTEINNLETWKQGAGKDPAKNHSWTYAPAKWEKVDGQWKCSMTRTCGNDATHVETLEAQVTSKEVLAAGCETKGKTKYTATFSNPDFATQKQTLEDIPAKGHDKTGMKTYPQVDAKCESTGTKAYYQCLAPGCGKYFSDAELTTLIGTGSEAELNTWKGKEVAQGGGLIPATGHKYESQVTTPATCEADGVRTYTCQNDPSHKYTEPITKLGHQFTTYVSNGDAKCGVNGTETATCDRDGCTQTDTKTDVGSALSHDPKKVDAVANTCQHAGNIEYWVCQRADCGKYFSDEACKNEITDKNSVILAQKDHDYVAVVTAPTCTAGGYTTHTCKNGCNNYYQDTRTPALGHKYDNGVVTKDPTCTEDGVKTFTCTNDGCDHSYTEPITKLGHDHQKDTAQSVEPDCTNDGKDVFVCSRCPDKYEEVVTALGHDWVSRDEKPATCMEPGWTGDAICFRCREKTTGEEIPMVDHSWNTGTQTQAPTCTTEEVFTYRCTTPGCTATKTETYDKAAHKLNTYVAAKAPTCTEPGNVAHYKCSTCPNFFDVDQTTILSTVEIAATGHSCQRVLIQNPTCLADGVQAHYKCTKCQNLFSDMDGKNPVTLEELKIPTKGHQYEAVVTAPTCEAGGYTTYTCSECAEGTQGHSYKDNETAKLGHDYEGVVTKEPTCTTTGIKTYTCKNDPTHQYTEPVDAKGHDNEVVVTAPTCTTGGYTTKTCKTCGNIEVTDRTGKQGHNLVKKDGQPADCENDGWYDYYQCDRDGCGKYFSDNTENPAEINNLETWKQGAGKDPAKNHSFTNYVSDGNATCTADGTKTAKCDRDGCTKTDTLPDVGSKLGHSFTNYVSDGNATCTADGTKTAKCDRSGCTETDTLPDVGSKLGHSFTNYVPDGNATCTADGTKTATCDRDGCTKTDTKTDVGSKLGHSFTNYVSDGNATCTADGTKTAKCDRSGCTETDTLPDVGSQKAHTGKLQKGREATCTQDGWKAYYQCSGCQAYFTEETCQNQITDLETWKTTEGQGLLKAQGHKGNMIEGVEATCEKDGWMDYYQCSGCEEFFSDAACTKQITDLATWKTTEDQGLLKATGHKPGEAKKENEKAADCVNEGSYEEVVYCSVCTAVISRETKTVDALGHVKVIDAAKAPTCTETGLTAGEHCSRCGAILKKQETVDALGHEEVTDAAVEATCTASGLTEGKHCGRCGKVLVAQTKVDPIAHTPKYFEGMSNGCLTDGWKAYYQCEVCKIYFADSACKTKIGDADALTLWRTEGDGKLTAPGHAGAQKDGKAATCTEDGWKAYYQCSNCKLYFTEEACQNEITDLETWKTTEGQGLLKATGHDEEILPAQEATCTNYGLKEGKKCKTCGVTTVTREIIPALGHDMVVDKAVAPTCTETGLTEGKHCTRCDAETVKQDVVEALGHSGKEQKGKAVTCTEDGWRAYYQCSNCKLYYTEEACENQIVDLESWKTTEGQGLLKATGHDEEILPAKEATCEEYGLKEGKKCKTCGITTVTREIIPALGHDEVIDEAVAPTCTETGLTEGKHCQRCTKVLVVQREINATGHKEVVDAAKAPTCTETGLTEGKHCETCSVVLKEQEEVPAKGHTEVVMPAVKAECEKTGLTEGKKCSECGEILLEQEEVPALEHEWDDGRVTTLSTCTEEGEKTLTCGLCNSTKTEPVEPLGHDVVIHKAQLPTNYSIGWAEYETCTRCDYTTYEAIPALGEPSVGTYSEFMENLKILEDYANAYARANPGKDPMLLLIKYVRTGVDRYNSGSWNIMAGYEDEDFAKYVKEQEETHNKAAETAEDMINVTALKNIKNFTLPNGDSVDFGHMFGTMDISYHNKSSVNHADVAGWAGDLVDLLSTADRHDVYKPDDTGRYPSVEEMVKTISENYLTKSIPGESDQFSQTDMYGDLDGFYVMQKLTGQEYEKGLLTQIFESYFTTGLTDVARADFFLKNRLGGVTSRNDIREATFAQYTGNSVIATLEGTREFNATDIADMRKACCYAFADYLCRLAGDYVEVDDNPYYEVFSTETSTLAPGITQQISKATTADGKQTVFYVATADITSPYVSVYANYKDADPSKGWGMQRVRDQANAAQERYGNPESEDYIPNYNVIASINGAGYNMTTGEPGGLLIMGGEEYHEPNNNGFFGILKDGSAYIGSTEEYRSLKAQGLVMEGISAFGSTLVKDGKISVSASGSYYDDRASRTAVGITKTGKVVFMVMDGRQEPVSCGGSMVEIAQVMLEAGCVEAVNLDGGGSTTYVARREGEETLSLISTPSDGFERSVSTSLLMVSTAPSSTAFDHAALDSEYKYMTIGTSVQVTATGVSSTGASAELPEGTTWAVSDPTVASISDDGVVTGLANGSFEVRLMLGDQVIGSRTMYVVVPDAVYFTRENINAVYGEPVELPVAALYEGKPVAITENDVTFTLSNATAGTTEGFTFTGNEASGVKKLIIKALAVNNPDATSGSMNITLFKPGEDSFDFENAIGGDRQLAWNRYVSNSTTTDNVTYTAVDVDESMVTTYNFAIDMTQIPIPEELAELTYMLPGADVEGNNSAWSFLLQLAERVSVLTEVKPVLKFDPNFTVDYSAMNVVCEYFILEETTLNEETNELTLSLRWKDQTKAIDPDTANPICILNNIKLTPKEDAAWDSKDRLSVLNTGNITYDIYLRANALYSFAQKPENQEKFKLYPFENKDVIIGGATEKGGHFADTYKEFSDEYTLVCGLKNGWIYEDGGYAYYVDGEKLTGIQKVGGFYYDFGENGINIGQTKYTGLFLDDEGVRYYSKDGLLTSGWYTDGDVSYCFDENGRGLDGTVVIDEVELTFDNGLQTGGYTGFITKSNGKTYHYNNGKMTYGWHYEGDDLYHFNTDTGVMTTGTHVIPDDEARAKGAYYDFADDGRTLRGYFNPSGYYYWAGLPKRDSWVKHGGDPDPNAWYHTNGTGHYVTDPSGREVFDLTIDGKTYRAVKIAYDGVVYTFDNTNGKLLVGGFKRENNKWYYYWAGTTFNGGWITVQGKTYYAYGDGHLATGSHTIDGKTYMFDNQGVLISSGVRILASLVQNNQMMEILIEDAPADLSSVRIAVWGQNAGQAATLVWNNAQKTEDGKWKLVIPMCQFEVEGEEVYQIHAYSGSAVLITTQIEVAETATHIYTDDYDPTCDACGAEREVEAAPVSVQAKLVQDDHMMEILVESANRALDDIRVKVWGRNAGEETTVTNDAEKIADGKWKLTIPMCQFEIEGEEIYEIHAFSGEEFLASTQLEVAETVPHTYTDDYDPTCDVCGAEREIVYTATVQAELVQDGHMMDILVESDDPVLEEVNVKVWGRNAGEETTVTNDAEKIADGKWKLTIPMCQFEIEGEEIYEIHAFSGEEFLASTQLEVAETVPHTYTDDYDPTCDVCGAERDVPIETTPMYRLYNPNSGEHFYTGSEEERDGLVALGWQLEGVAWNAPVDEGAPVYRTYNPNSGDHHYTMSWEEVENLVAVGWQYEGVAWNSAAPTEENVGQFRLYNPNADCGSHHYTSSVEERDYLVSLGWIFEGIGWFGIR